MVAQQETIVGENIRNMLMIKGKRSMRSRPLSPSALTMSTSATDEGGSVVSEEWAAANSTASEEEEDMARCLILLAQGSSQMKNCNPKNINKTTSYECKTCNRSFPSFQALGGHRTSHKKPKLIIAVTEPKKHPLIFNDHSNQIQQQKFDQFVGNGVSLTLQMANSSPSSHSTNIVNSNNTNVISKVKVHKCGICGAEFSSGQALGGHMRRHRPIGTSNTVPSSSTTTVKVVQTVVMPAEMTATRNILSLDLNLPAPIEEDQIQHRDNSSKFVFGANEKTLVFTASSLVDCHY